MEITKYIHQNYNESIAYQDLQYEVKIVRRNMCLFLLPQAEGKGPWGERGEGGQREEGRASLRRDAATRPARTGFLWPV